MKRKTYLLRRLALLVVSAFVVAGAAWALSVVNEKMTIRYQAVGIITDSAGTPLDGVEVLLMLQPPPSGGAKLDDLFEAEGVLYGRHSPEGHLVRAVGPPIGLSGVSGAYIVRATGRTGAAQAIRLGLDSGRPAFEVAWIVFRKSGYADLTRTVSILGWRPAPRDWGTFVNRLPHFSMEREAS